MITTLAGLNSFRLTQELQKRISDFIKTSGDFGLERFRAGESDYAKLAESIQAMPFLADRRMVVIEAPSENKQLAEKIDEFLALANEQTEVLFVESKFDKRSSIYKVLKKKTEFVEYNELDESDLLRWIVDFAEEQGGSIGSSEARYLLQRVGLNQLRLSNELLKLLSYRPQVSRQNIELLTVSTPQSTVFELLEAAFAGNSAKMLTIYEDQRRQKVEPQAILALLVWQLHALAVVKAAGSAPAASIASASKLNPFVVRKTQTLARGISADKIKKLVRSALELDVRLKSEQIDANAALQNLLLSINR
jgi:DNA polymerase-3 subunit delta